MLVDGFELKSRPHILFISIEFINQFLLKTMLFILQRRISIFRFSHTKVDVKLPKILLQRLMISSQRFYSESKPEEYTEDVEEWVSTLDDDKKRRIRLIQSDVRAKKPIIFIF